MLTSCYEQLEGTKGVIRRMEGHNKMGKEKMTTILKALQRKPTQTSLIIEGELRCSRWYDNLGFV